MKNKPLCSDKIPRLPWLKSYLYPNKYQKLAINTCFLPETENRLPKKKNNEICLEKRLPKKKNNEK